MAKRVAKRGKKGSAARNPFADRGGFVAFREISSDDYLAIVETVEAVALAALPERLPESSMAGAAQVSLLELHAAFRMIRGTDLYTALRELRLEELKRRLEANARLPPPVAARQCGFGHFSPVQRLFLLRFGIPFNTWWREASDAMRLAKKAAAPRAPSEAGPSKASKSYLNAASSHERCRQQQGEAVMALR